MNEKPVGPIIAIIVPCYNEEEVLPETAKRLSSTMQQLINEQIIDKYSKILFVDDGSGDNTWGLIEKYHAENPSLFCGIKLSGNRGHQNALLCGLLAVTDHVNAAISIDADLQDDINVIGKMIEKYRAGYEIVYGVRSNRETDSFFKRATAQGFYRFMRFLGVDLVYNHADFRLMGQNALKALSEYGEVNLFLRGIVPMLGFKTGIEYYTRTERLAGTSKYPLRKMFKFALEGITSFSIKPIRMITFLGIFIFTISMVMIVYFFVRYFTGHTVSGWASIACSLWGIGGLILFSIGIIGEYIGKIYLEAKRRPRYHIEQFLYAKGIENDDNKTPEKIYNIIQVGEKHALQ
ncbi:MAG: glycosyltransferase family 2 protein [Treponema sp.]|jgi:glycosyltransferase involved in cell wall biosynthesis|nr:glycosyltransferase family 2 protein [Treponema sp.]